MLRKIFTILSMRAFGIIKSPSDSTLHYRWIYIIPLIALIFSFSFISLSSVRVYACTTVASILTRLPTSPALLSKWLMNSDVASECQNEPEKPLKAALGSSSSENSGIRFILLVGKYRNGFRPFPTEGTSCLPKRPRSNMSFSRFLKVPMLE